MTTKREQILVALGQGLVIERNAPIKDFELTFAALSDGAIDQTEEFVNGPDGSVYEFTMTPVLVLAVEGGTTTTRDAAMSMLIDQYLTLLSGIKASLGLMGLITDMRPQPPDFEANDLWGAAGVKAAELSIEIDYWSDRSVG